MHSVHSQYLDLQIGISKGGMSGFATDFPFAAIHKTNNFLRNKWRILLEILMQEFDSFPGRICVYVM